MGPHFSANKSNSGVADPNPVGSVLFFYYYFDLESDSKKLHGIPCHIKIYQNQSNFQKKTLKFRKKLSLIYLNIRMDKKNVVHPYYVHIN